MGRKASRKGRDPDDYDDEEGGLKVRIRLKQAESEEQSPSESEPSQPPKHAVIKLRLQPDDQKKRRPASQGGRGRKRQRADSAGAEDEGGRGGLPEEVRQELLRTALLQTHRAIQAKDSYAIFAEPVDVTQAPNYNEIIKTPMDLSTMFQRIEAGHYPDIAAYQVDFELMCNNALTYNYAPDNFYNKAARKLLAAGSKIVEKEARRHTKQLAAAVAALQPGDDEVDVLSMGASDRPSDSETAAPDEEAERSENETSKKKKRSRRVSVAAKGSQEDTSAQALLAALKAQAEGAASAIRQAGLLGPRLVVDGKGNVRWGPAAMAQLAYVPPGATGQGGSGSTLKGEVGPLPTAQRQQKVQKAAPVRSLLSGPYVGHQPETDTARAQLTRAQTDAVAVVFGDTKGYEYGRGLMAMARGAGLKAHGEAVLGALTDGRYQPATWPDVDIWSDLARLGEADVKPVTRDELAGLEGLAKLGVPAPDLSRVVEAPGPRKFAHHQDLLDDTAGLLWELEKTQLRRIRYGRTGESYTPRELALAQEVVYRLGALMALATPAAVGATAAPQAASQAAPAPAAVPAQASTAAASNGLSA